MRHSVLALGTTLLALSLAPASAQSGTVDVPHAGGKLALPVTITPASSAKVAHAAATQSAEPDGVMVLPLPDSGHVLRTEHFSGSGSVTTLVPAQSQGATLLFADSVCTSRWNVAGTAHSLSSSLGKEDTTDDWSRRHQEAVLLISTIHVPTAGAAADSAAQADAPSNRDLARTPWTDAAGMRHEVSTKRRDGEEREAWLARHRMVVAAFAARLQPQP